MEIALTNQGDRQKLLSALETFARQHQLPAAVRQSADLALEEHLTNIWRYAFGDNRPHEIRVRFELEQNQFSIVVEDDGKAFDPLQMPEVDTSVPLENRPIGGLGIHLIRKSMDEVSYRREGDKNVLRLRKRLPE